MTIHTTEQKIISFFCIAFIVTAYYPVAWNHSWCHHVSTIITNFPSSVWWSASTGKGEGSKKDAELKNYKYNIWLAMYRKVLAHHPGQSVSLARHKSNNDNKLIIINRASISFAPGPPPQWGPAKNDDDDDDTPHIIIVAIGRNEAGMKSRREDFFVLQNGCGLVCGVGYSRFALTIYSATRRLCLL